MSMQGQNIQSDRYAVIPRTLSFIQRDDQLLLLQIPNDHGAWAGRLNGVGGHVEQGEDPLNSAKREIREETGLLVEDLRLCGVVIVNAGGKLGIGIYVFVGGVQRGEPRTGAEGESNWYPIDCLETLNLVEDLPILIPRALQCYRDKETFSAVYRYDADGELDIHIHT